MLRFVRLAIVTLCVSAATGCASTMNVSSHVDRNVDFAKYRTFEWGRADALPAGDARLDKNPFFHDHMQGAVEKQMAARGYTHTSRRPDLLIHYHANITPRVDINHLEYEHVRPRGDVNGFDREYGSCSGDDCLYGAPEYDAGTLVLDIVDARTKKVVWRGWAQDNLEGVLENLDRMARTIDEAVKRMLERLPQA
jgi:hypothetical protein